MANEPEDPERASVLVFEHGEGSSGSAVIERGGEWRFLRGMEEPPADWMHPDFDDDAWDEGPSGFGYGEGDPATTLEDMQFGYSSLYLRREFEVADPTEVEALILGVQTTGGYVAYLNGVEVNRSTTTSFRPGVPVSHDVGAIVSENPQETFWKRIGRPGIPRAGLSDAVYLLGHLFLGGPAPVPPFPDCGPGLRPTDAEIGCRMPPVSCR